MLRDIPVVTKPSVLDEKKGKSVKLRFFINQRKLSEPAGVQMAPAGAALGRRTPPRYALTPL